MEISSHITDNAAIIELGQRIHRRRVERNLTQAALAQEAGVSKRTVERLEAGGSVQLSNFIRVMRALNISENLNLLIPEAVPSPMEQLKRRGKARVRASASQVEEQTEKWNWGDDS